MIWDVMYPSKVEALRGPSGRLLQYDPSTDEVNVLADGLYLANGVAVGEDESYLVFVETFYSRVSKYYLSGEKKGTIEYVIDGYPAPACKLFWCYMISQHDTVLSSLRIPFQGSTESIVHGRVSVQNRNIVMPLGFRKF